MMDYERYQGAKQSVLQKKTIASSLQTAKNLVDMSQVLMNPPMNVFYPYVIGTYFHIDELGEETKNIPNMVSDCKAITV